MLWDATYKIAILCVKSNYNKIYDIVSSVIKIAENKLGNGKNYNQ